MNNNPKSTPIVSVIIPTHNRDKYIKSAIDSILAQTFKSYELFVIDDGSDDNTEEVVTSIKSSKVNYIRLQKNRGASYSRNIAINKSLGKYIAFLDSDDIAKKDRLKTQLKAIKSLPKHTGLVYSDLIANSNDKNHYINSPVFTAYDHNLFKKGLCYKFKGIPLSSVLIKRECFTKTGYFDEKLGRYIDLEFFIRLSRNYSFQHIPKALTITNKPDERISDDENSLLFAQKLILKKYLKDIKKEKKILAIHYFAIGNNYFRNGNNKTGKNYLLNAWKNDQTNLLYLSTLIIANTSRDLYMFFLRLKRKLF